jgi:hypothetical protein
VANSFAVTDLVAREALRVAHESLTMIGTVDRQYDDSFKYGGKHGSTLRVKKPNQYIRREGSRVMDVQDQDEETQTITVATQDGVDMRFNSQELIQSVDSAGKFDELSKNYITPAVKGLVSGIEADAIEFWTKATANTVGTAGTALTTIEVPGLARARLNKNLAPKDGNRIIQLESTAMAGIVNGSKALFHDGGQLKEAFREGFISRNAMADWYENDRMWTMPNSADVAAEINGGTLTSGIEELTVDGLTNAPVAGMVFTVEGIYDVHPETKVAYPHLKQFVVTASSTTTDLNFSTELLGHARRQQQHCFRRRREHELRSAVDVPQGSVPVRDGGLADHGRRSQVRASDAGRLVDPGLDGVGHPQRRVADALGYLIRQVCTTA